MSAFVPVFSKAFKFRIVQRTLWIVSRMVVVGTIIVGVGFGEGSGSTFLYMTVSFWEGLEKRPMVNSVTRLAQTE